MTLTPSADHRTVDGAPGANARCTDCCGAHVTGIANAQRNDKLKIISDEIHAALDYVTVVVFALAPTVIGLAGLAAIISYVLAVVHLDYPCGFSSS
jgi:hypothetical protein